MSRNTASLLLSDNPLVPVSAANVSAVAPGCAIGSLLPEAWHKRRVVCKYNGRYILRAGWVCSVQAGDVVEFHEIVEGDNALRSVLQIVVAVAAIVTGQYYGVYAALAVSVVGNLAINALLPIQAPQLNDQQAPGSVYNVQLSGNQARVDQAIPVIYGRHLVKPDYAGEPYTVYEDNDAYFHAVYTVGQGRYSIEQELIGRTRLGSYQDVLVARKLEPGEYPADVLPTVVSSREVPVQDMPQGRYVGGFTACAPQRKVHAVGLDFVFPRGLGNYNDEGNLTNWDVTWRVERREIDDQGNSLSDWMLLSNEIQSGTTNTPLRVTRYYPVAVQRCLIRVLRTSVYNNNQSVLNEIQWSGMKGYLADAAPLCPTATHYELKLRSSDQLSGLSQNQFALVVQRLLRVWNPVDGWTDDGDEVATRNPFHALADAWTNVDYVTTALPDSRVDLQSLYDLSLIAADRQDRFDYIFDGQVPGWQAAALIARTGRATPFRRNGVHTAVRDQLQTLTVTAFTSRNILPGSFSAQYLLPNSQTPDGIVAEYFDYRSWDWVEVECPAPGFTVTDPADPRYDGALPSMSKPVRKRYPGITGPTHCEREGLYDATVPVYRRKLPSWSTEMQGTLVAFGSEVLLAPAIARYGQSGDVAFWDSGTRVMGLTEPPDFSGTGPFYISLLRDDGSLADPITVTAGPGQNDVTLAASPDFTVIVDDGTRERPKYVFGDTVTQRQLVRVTGIEHQGADENGIQAYGISSTVDDDRVHQADNALLPTPGVIQDPVGEVTADPGTYFVNINNSDGFDEATGRLIIEHIFRSDGVERIKLSDASTRELINEWLIGSPAEPGVGAQYELLATVIAGSLSVDSSATGVWLSLSTTREFRALSVPLSSVQLQFRIRLAANLVEQDSAVIRIYPS